MGVNEILYFKLISHFFNQANLIEYIESIDIEIGLNIIIKWFVEQQSYHKLGKNNQLHATTLRVLSRPWGPSKDSCDARLRTNGLPEHGSWCPATHQA